MLIISKVKYFSINYQMDWDTKAKPEDLNFSIWLLIDKLWSICTTLFICKSQRPIEVSEDNSLHFTDGDMEVQCGDMIASIHGVQGDTRDTEHIVHLYKL